MDIVFCKIRVMTYERDVIKWIMHTTAAILCSRPSRGALKDAAVSTSGAVRGSVCDSGNLCNEIFKIPKKKTQFLVISLSSLEGMPEDRSPIFVHFWSAWFASIGPLRRRKIWRTTCPYGGRLLRALTVIYHPCSHPYSPSPNYHRLCTSIV